MVVYVYLLENYSKHFDDYTFWLSGERSLGSLFLSFNVVNFKIAFFQAYVWRNSRVFDLPVFLPIEQMVCLIIINECFISSQNFNVIRCLRYSGSL